MSRRLILVIVAVAVVAALAYYFYAGDAVKVEAGDYGTVEGVTTVVFNDGSEKTITTVRTGEFQTGSLLHDNTGVDRFRGTFTYEPNKHLADEVRVLCDDTDPLHMTTLTVLARTGSREVVVTERALSQTESDAYVTVESGSSVQLWSVGVTAEDLEAANSVWDVGVNNLVWRLEVWLNWRSNSSAVEGFQVEFVVPFTVLTFAPALTDEEIADYQAQQQQDIETGRTSITDWKVDKNIQFDQTVETSYKKLTSGTSSTAAWRRL